MGSCGLLSVWPFVLWPYVRGLLSVWPFVRIPSAAQSKQARRLTDIVSSMRLHSRARITWVFIKSFEVFRLFFRFLKFLRFFIF